MSGVLPCKAGSVQWPISVDVVINTSKIHDDKQEYHMNLYCINYFYFLKFSRRVSSAALTCENLSVDGTPPPFRKPCLARCSALVERDFVMKTQYQNLGLCSYERHVISYANWFRECYDQ